jgi:hypothetical protein
MVKRSQSGEIPDRLTAFCETKALTAKARSPQEIKIGAEPGFSE